MVAYIPAATGLQDDQFHPRSKQRNSSNTLPICAPTKVTLA